MIAPAGALFATCTMKAPCSLMTVAGPAKMLAVEFSVLKRESSK